MDKKNKAEKIKQLKLTTCLAAIQEVYEDPKYNYPQQFEFHYFSIKKTLSGWNQYMKTDGEKGDPPLPQFDFYRHTDKETFKKWVRDIFFPDYRERSHKDALKSAFHPDNIDDVCVLSQQDILEIENNANNKHYNRLTYKQERFIDCSNYNNTSNCSLFSKTGKGLFFVLMSFYYPTDCIDNPLYLLCLASFRTVFSQTPHRRGIACLIAKAEAKDIRECKTITFFIRCDKNVTKMRRY